MTNRFIAILIVTLAWPTSALPQEVKLPGDAPEFFVVTSLNDKNFVIERRPPSSKLVDVPNIVYKPEFQTLRATDAKGKMLTAAEVRKRLKLGSVVLVSPDEGPVDPVLLSIVRAETVVLLDVLPRKGATGATISE